MSSPPPHDPHAQPLMVRPRSPKLLLLPAKGRQRAHARGAPDRMDPKFDRIWDMRGNTAKRSNGNGCVRLCVCAVVVLAPRGVNAPSHGHSGKAVARVAALVARVL